MNILNHPAIRRTMVRWGVHPDARKQASSPQDIERLPLPAMLHIPLLQHSGAPAKPVVSVGQHVLKGELLGARQGNISAPIHAPTSGTVVAISDYPAPHPSGLGVLSVSLEPDGEDRWIECAETDPFSLSPAQIAERVAAAGVVGLGGATFPSSVKMLLGQRSQVHTLLVNGSECEPYLSCDDRLMRERAAKIIEGIRIVLHAVGATKALCGIENNKPAAIEAMRRAAADFAAIEVIALPTRYPMGSDRQLIHVLTGLEVPSDGRSADVGVLVHNVGTLYAIQQAVRFGRPLISRVVTVAGGAVARPRNLDVLIGTPARLLMGGPMMGLQLPSLDAPIIKGSSGILALGAHEIAQEQPSPCIRCGQCVSACPMNLMPFEMSAHIRIGDLEAVQGIKDCISCGSCSYVCPAHIPLSHYFDYAKGELTARERGKMRQESIRQLTSARKERLEREAREKAEAAARRKAERERAKAATAKEATS